MRQEMEIKLKKEEEERKERREKVNKIMARTRTKNIEKSGNVSTKVWVLFMYFSNIIQLTVFDKFIFLF